MWAGVAVVFGSHGGPFSLRMHMRWWGSGVRGPPMERVLLAIGSAYGRCLGVGAHAMFELGLRVRLVLLRQRPPRLISRPTEPHCRCCAHSQTAQPLAPVAQQPQPALKQLDVLAEGLYDESLTARTAAAAGVCALFSDLNNLQVP